MLPADANAIAVHKLIWRCPRVRPEAVRLSKTMWGWSGACAMTALELPGQRRYAAASSSSPPGSWRNTTARVRAPMQSFSHSSKITTRRLPVHGVPWPSISKAGDSKSCSVALDAGGVISGMRPYRHMQSRRVAPRFLRDHRTRVSGAIVRIDGEGRVRSFGRGGLRDRLPCRGGRRKERGKNERRRAQKFEAGHAILLLLARNPCACCPLR